MADAADVLLALYSDSVAHGRHHEEQRAAMTNLVVLVCAALLGIVGFDDAITRADLPLALFLTGLGLYGAAFSAKQHERFDLHQERGKRFRQGIEGLLPETSISRIRAAAADKVKAEHPLLYPIRLYWFWVGLPLAIAGIGAYLTACILLAR